MVAKCCFTARLWFDGELKKHSSCSQLQLFVDQIEENIWNHSILMKIL